MGIVETFPKVVTAIVCHRRFYGSTGRLIDEKFRRFFASGNPFTARRRVFFVGVGEARVDYTWNLMLLLADKNSQSMQLQHTKSRLLALRSD